MAGVRQAWSSLLAYLTVLQGCKETRQLLLQGHTQSQQHFHNLPHLKT